MVNILLQLLVNDYIFHKVLQYLIWFHGKDLQKEMQKQKPRYISLPSFFEWAIPKLDINQHPDIVELRTRIEQL
ncbi:hypothetical protein C7H19_15030 [Aphanothece hegewaldii CCALA 016]|uniref:Uncharacterized protein n=1 Tax=Aphanothece hegewaldii CCALA 016 TaxID=2107694 RepID=A0A2T1LW30_9CHRO|nr:hypothetical protein [Aphanothece hegewaldii]PSF36053.1 hypothetical protein C7H19_15030 [Aphanothece hegewaldii CCALA 016]